MNTMREKEKGDTNRATGPSFARRKLLQFSGLYRLLGISSRLSILEIMRSVNTSKINDSIKT